MGWLFTYGQKRAALIAERSKGQEWARSDGVLVKDAVLAHCYRGGVFKGTFYAVHERTVYVTDGPPDVERWIEVTLMQCHNYQGYGMSWGYKDMEETMGPNEVSCPLGYLAMVPERTCAADCANCAAGHCSRKWARDWRTRVRAYHAEHKAKREAKRKATTT